MELLNSYNFVLFVLTQMILMFTIPAIISGIKYSKLDYFFIIVISTLSLFLFKMFDSASLIILTSFIIIMYFVKIKWYSILLIMTSQIILYCANYMYIVIYAYITKISDSIFVIFPSFFVVYVTISILFSYIINRVLKKISTPYLILNKGFLIVISTILLLTFSLFFFYSQINSDEAKVIRQYSFIFIGITIFLSILTFVISQFLLKEMKYKRNQEEIETYYEYTLKIEAINNEMRKFRHDYVNILTTLSEYIREDDMPGLRDYFNKNIVPMKDNLQMNAIKLNGIENLKVREIKGLITAKILRAQEMNIPISIEIPDEVSSINLNMIDLSRSIGIILDNAIEASTEIDDPIIRVAFIESENSVTFIVMNKCADDIPRIHELFQESFSTKGEGRGLGLSTLKEIADNADNVLLDTIIENGFFIQKVEIIKNYIMIEEKPMEIALATDNPYEVLEQAKNMNDIGCYFLDIQLSTDINGIKLGSEIRKHDPVGNIIFVTSHSELTYLTFVYKVAAMDFIFKDDPAELRTRIIDCLETAHTRLQLLSKDNSVETIELKRGSNSVYVQYDDIMFFESSTKSHRLIAHLDNRQIEFYGNLKELSQLDDRFFRCHNSFVVNRHNIESIDSKERIVYFKNKEHCYASVRNVKKI